MSPELSPYRYLIAGHTDATGGDAYNLDLSRRRALAVRDYLVSAFPIDPHRLVIVGFGFRQLKRPDAPHAAVNRRVETLLIVS
jgi:outer membrane protein OmpA-like peptidoglycan-associated protein